jgi:hypothetical protein
MWYALRKSAKADADFASSAVELLQSMPFLGLAGKC